MIRRSTKVYTKRGEYGEGRGNMVDERSDAVEAFEMPRVALPDLAPGEGVTVRVHFYRPCEVTPGSRLFAAMRGHGDAIRAGMFDIEWDGLSEEARAVFEKAAAAVR
jgi:hypothetical protein